MTGVLRPPIVAVTSWSNAVHTLGRSTVDGLGLAGNVAMSQS
jgi:hypothetical protein